MLSGISLAFPALATAMGGSLLVYGLVLDCGLTIPKQGENILSLFFFLYSFLSPYFSYQTTRMIDGLRVVFF